MSEFKIQLNWQRTTADFNYKTYDRTHTIQFNGGIKVQASAAPEYLGKAELVNPEELFVAALSSCHMLTFLAMAAMQGYAVDHYEDHAVGALGKNPQGKMCVTQVVLRPKVTFSSDKQPDATALHQLHEKAHDNCFIAHSVSTEVHVDIAA